MSAVVFPSLRSRFLSPLLALPAFLCRHVLTCMVKSLHIRVRQAPVNTCWSRPSMEAGPCF